MQDVAENYAVLNITYNNQQGELPDPVRYDSGDEEIRQWALEAIQAGGVRGIRADAAADLTDFVVERFPPANGITYSRISLRPKAAFGGGYVGTQTNDQAYLPHV